MLPVILHQRHDLGDAGLVVGAEAGGAVGHDQFVSADLLQAFKVLFPHHDALFGVQGDVAAPVRQLAGLQRRGRNAVDGVHVGDQAQAFFVFHSRRRGQNAVHIAAVRKPHFLKAQFLHFLFQQPRQVELAVRGGIGLPGVLVRGGQDARVP